MPALIDRTGEINYTNNGMKMTIVAYRNANDLDVKLENGNILQNRAYNAFKKGQIKNNDRTGEKTRAKNGMLMTIIKYRSAIDIDIQFEDGEIIEHKHYDQFAQGYIKHPNISIAKDYYSEQRIGQTNKNKNGHTMKIIKYQDANNISVQFDNNIVRHNVRYREFLTGSISEHSTPRNTKDHQNKRIGETIIANNGMKMTIIDYQDSDNINIMFENGMLIIEKTYRQFKSKSVDYLRQYKTIKIGQIAYQAKNKTAFYVKCEKCGLSDVMTYEQIQNHVCDETMVLLNIPENNISNNIPAPVPPGAYII